MEVSVSSVKPIQWGWDEKKESPRYVSLRESVSLGPVAAPTNLQEARAIVQRAEVESDPRMLAVLDTALASFCTTDRRVKSLVDANMHWSILRLDLPKTKSAAIAAINREGRRYFGGSSAVIQEDIHSTLSEILWKTVGVSQWEQMLCSLTEDVPGSQAKAEEFLQEWRLAEESSLQIPKKKLDAWLQTLHPSQLLQFFLIFSIWGREGKQEAEAIADSLFGYLVLPGYYQKLQASELQILRDCIVGNRLYLQKLSQLLGDQLFLQVKGEERRLIASRFLLDAHSAYFHTLIECEPATSTFDLTTASFTAKGMRLFIRWCMAGFGQTVHFEEELGVKDLEPLLLTGMSLGLTNEGEFLESVQIEYKKRLSCETLTEILSIANRRNLTLLFGACVHYINTYPSSNIRVILQKDGSYLVEQMEEDGFFDPPQEILDALIGIPKLSKASLSTCRPRRRSRCSGFFSGLSKVANRVVGLVKKVSDHSLGRLAKRVGVAAFSIWSLEQMTGVSWENTRDFPLASGLAVGYPVFCAVSRKCKQRRRNAPISWSLPHLLPLSLQRGFFRTTEKVYGCFNTCRRRRASSPERGLLSSRNQLLEALPPQLQELTLVKAQDFTREDGLFLATRLPSLRGLEMGEHPMLEPEDWNFLRAFAPHLQRLSFTFARGQQPRALNQVELFRLLEEGNVTVEVSLFDTTAIYTHTPITFLETTPDTMRVHLTLKHTPIPDGLVLFEAPESYTTEFLGWPEVFSVLRRSFPRLERFDCYAPITDTDVETFLPSLRSCTSLQLHQGTKRFTNAGLDRLARGCPLRELMLQMVDIGTPGIAALVEHTQNLEKISFHGCFGVTNTSLALLQRLPHLRECYLSWLVHITDTGVRILLTSKSLKECLVYSCDGVSSQLVTQLVRKSLKVRAPQIEAFRQHWKKQIALSVPQHTAKILLPFFTIQSVLLCGRAILRTKAAQLGIQPQRAENILTLSMGEGVARLYPEQFSIDYWRPILENLKKDPQKIVSVDQAAFHPLEGREGFFFGLENLFSMRDTLSTQMVSIYEAYAKKTFSEASFKAMQALSEQFRKDVERVIGSNGGARRRDLQELIPLVLMHARDGEDLYQGLVDTWRDIALDAYISKVKEKGDALAWSDEQRILAVFAPIFLHFDFFVGLFAPIEEPPFLEHKERKEEKKEVKIQKKDDQSILEDD